MTLGRFAGYHFLLLQQMAFVLLLFTVCRLLFVFINHNFFPPLSFWILLKCILAGWRFDLSSVMLFNIPVWALYLLPVKQRNTNWYLNFNQGLFIAINSILLLVSIADVFTFRYILKRVTIKELMLAKTGDKIFPLLLSSIQTHWYSVFLFLLLVYILYIFCRAKRPQKLLVDLKTDLPVLLLACAATVIGIRGGLQKIPISIIAAGDMTGNKYSSIVLNTPFSITYTASQPLLPDFAFMDATSAEDTYPCFHKKKSKAHMDKKNVVVIILESFSAEYVGALNNGKGYTPFLDSLTTKGLLFTRCYANGKTSIDAIPALLNSLPTYTSQAFIYSYYSSDNINGFASLLKPYGYTSAFFHGGHNGTMNFDTYASIAGYDHYFGFDEFPEKDASSTPWGIDDGPYLHFVKLRLDNLTQPFHAAIFTLSSHHPYKIPEAAAKQYGQSIHPIIPTIRYTDQALSAFFKEASSAPWFNNTVFLLCADHTGPYQENPQWNEMSFYHIFAMLYAPGKNLRGKYNGVVQQTDFMPTILNYLDYAGNYVAFGQDVFDSTCPRVSMHYLNNVYSLIDSAYFFQTDFGHGRIYHHTSDPQLAQSKEELTMPEELKRDTLLKAILQNYKYRLEKNILTAE